MNKILTMLTFLLAPSIILTPFTTFADIGPARHIPCEECIYSCFDCCKMQEIVPMPGCGSCYFGDCNFKAICADYLDKNPNKCPDKAKPNTPDGTSEVPQAEPNNTTADNSQTKPNDINFNDTSQVPPPVENKRSCSSIMYASDQTGIWALLTAFVFGLLLVLRRRTTTERR